jgi:hypothetical protein
VCSDVQKLASDYSFRLTHRFEKHTNKYVELKKLANWFYDTKNNWGLDGLLQQTVGAYAFAPTKYMYS